MFDLEAKKNEWRARLKPKPVNTGTPKILEKLKQKPKRV